MPAPLTVTPRNSAPRPVVGVLLLNIGSPDAPTAGAVRRYLAEFLSDRRIVELPRWLWLPLLHGVILNVRAFRSARAYRRVWRADGSPLVQHTRQIALELQSVLDRRLGEAVRVGVAMRYGNPSIRSALADFHAAGVTRIVVLPLHPQYCASTAGSAFDGVAKALSGARHVPELRFVSGYHDHPGYIRALAESVRRHGVLAGGGRHLVFSFHSIPVAYAEQGDPYPVQVRETSVLLARALGLGPEDWTLAYQSRFMAGRWLEPSTDSVLDRLAAAGTRRAAVMSPVFATDCLETLEDLGHHATERFRAAGGESLTVVPCLNDGPAHVEFLADLVQEQAVGWLHRGQVLPWPVRQSGR